MADDRTLAPSPSRQRRAWRAGLRPRSEWLLPAAACGLLALALEGRSGSGDAIATVLRPGSVTAAAWLDTVVDALVVGWVVAALLVLAVAVLGRRLGAVSSSEARRLRAGSSRPAWLGRAAIALALGAGSMLALRGVLAGAARGVDATEASLTALWLGWASRVGVVLAMALALAALLELRLDRSERRDRLRLSREQARQLARDGGRSR
ncbi:MAG: hypothetical protein AB1Z98_16030 [Nannocystaceae bacterium]